MILPLTKIGFFNPGRLTDEEIEQSFIARIPLFQFVFKKIISEKPSSIPQHHLLIGQRGMGKTSLLIRMAAELRKAPYKDAFIPLSFPEEQYNIDRLSKFWLNCLDALADELDKEGRREELNALDTEIRNLSRQTALDANAVYNTFKKWVDKTGRRPILLVDNLNLIFSKISKEEQHQLRATLMSKGSPVLVGASATPIDETLDYGAPFYDAFQTNYLKKLSFNESMDVLTNLAKITGNADFANNLYRQKGKVNALYDLTGGTPRTLAILFPLIQNGFSEDIQTDLDALLDVVTPLYKARFEELSQQLQVVLDAAALNWDPITIEQLREKTLLENQQLSPQLKRLVDVGWLQKLDAYEAKGGAYEVSERFFNIWYLMRRSSRRQKRELYCLTKFLETFYGNNLPEIAESRAICKTENLNQVTLDLALADALQESELSEKLRKKSYEALINLSFENEEILKTFSIPKQVTEDKLKELSDEFDIKIQQKNYSELETLLNKILKLDNNNESALYALGTIYTKYLNKYPDAEYAFKKVIEINENNESVWFELGNLYMEYLNRYQDAENAFKASIKIGSKLRGWVGLSRLYLDHLLEYEKAEIVLQNAIEIDNKDSFVWSSLGRLYLDCLGKYDKAENAYRNAVELDKNDSYAWLSLGRLYMSYLNRYDDAENAFKMSAEVNDADDNSGHAWNGLGLLYGVYLKQFAKAEQAFKRAIGIHNNANVQTNLGILYMNYIHDIDKAEDAFKKAIKLDKEYSFAWQSIAILNMNYLNKYEDAEDDFKKAINFDKTNGVIWEHLSRLYLSKMNRYSDAALALKEAINLGENTPEVWNTLGLLNDIFLHNYNDAEDAYLKAIDLDPNFPYPKYNLVFLWRDNLQKFTEAKQLFSGLSQTEKIIDSYILNQALFAYHDKNIGIAENFFKEALLSIGDSLPPDTTDDWYRSAGVIIKLGYTESLLNVFRENGYDTIFRPFYVAIEALTKKEDERFFNSVAAEVREPAKKIMAMIKNHIS